MKTSFTRLFVLVGIACFFGSSALATTYRVRRGECLQLICLKLFGSTRVWRTVARENHLKSPFSLRVGQHLKLPALPRISKARGKRLVIAFWRHKLNKKNGTLSARSIASRVPPEEEFHRLFIEGKKRFDLKDYAASIEWFEKSRNRNPEYLPAWFYSIKAYSALGENGKQSETRRQLLERYPHLNGLPMFKSASAGEP